jgi:predicted DCC family thiol-disulfide oxidoreductase YuxK
MTDNPIILFDGICNFCNNIVKFVLKRNNKKPVYFASLQSETGKKILQEYGLPMDDMQTIVFIENGKVYTRSSAGLRICRYLRGAWPLCYGLIIIPKFIRDAVYNWIARNRYKWFGKKEECMIPTAEMKNRFL